jgi:hypothetical protein
VNADAPESATHGSRPRRSNSTFRAGTYFASIRGDQGVQPTGCSFMHKENGQTVETSVEARAGILDRPTLAVLIISTALLIGLFAVIYVGFFLR